MKMYDASYTRLRDENVKSSPEKEHKPEPEYPTLDVTDWEGMRGKKVGDKIKMDIEVVVKSSSEGEQYGRGMPKKDTPRKNTLLVTKYAMENGNGEEPKTIKQAARDLKHEYAE